MKTIKELRDYLLDNYLDDDGDLMLSGLDFSDFDGDVCIGGMKIKGNLSQSGHEVKGTLSQSGHEVKGTLYQSYQEVQGDLYQSRHEVQGDLSHGNSKYGGELIEGSYSKSLKEITLEELAKMGYKLKGDEHEDEIKKYYFGINND